MADPSYIVDGVLTDPEAWVALASTDITGDTALVTYTSADDGSSLDWSQFMDLVLITYVRNTGTPAWYTTTTKMNFNNDTTSGNYQIQYFSGNGTAAAASHAGSANHALGGEDMPGANVAANVFGCSVAQIFDINSGKYKSGITRSGAENADNPYVTCSSWTWLSQAPITEIDLITGSVNFVDGCRFDLFGILPRMVA